MTPTDEPALITPQTKPPRLHSLRHALTSMRQGLGARRASAYARVQERAVELQEVIGHAGREAVIRLQPVTATLVGRLSDPLLWLRLSALLCMLMGGSCDWWSPTPG